MANPQQQRPQEKQGKQAQESQDQQAGKSGQKGQQQPPQPRPRDGERDVRRDESSANKPGSSKDDPEGDDEEA